MPWSHWSYKILYICVCLWVCVSLKITQLHEWACTCGCAGTMLMLLREKRPTGLIMRFCVAPGYRCVRGAVALLAHFWLSNRNLLDHKSKMRVCVSACWNTVLPGHNVQMDGYQSLYVHVQVLTATGVVKCLCGLVSHAKSVGVCVVSWTLLRFKPSEKLLWLHKNASACLLDWKLFTFREKHQHLVSWCSDSACYTMLLVWWRVAVEDAWHTISIFH